MVTKMEFFEIGLKMLTLKSAWFETKLNQCVGPLLQVLTVPI